MNLLIEPMSIKINIKHKKNVNKVKSIGNGIHLKEPAKTKRMKNKILKKS